MQMAGMQTDKVQTGKVQIEIRELQDGDIESLAEIEASAFSMPWSAGDFRELLACPECLYLVAAVEGRVVGSCGCRVICGEGNIDNVVVSEPYRNLGICQALLGELIARGETEGVPAFTLEVRVSNAAAIHVYEKFGFLSAGIRPGFYEKPTEDAMIMWRRSK